MTDRANVYICPECGGPTVTIDIDKGVTPMFLKCRSSGNVGDCDGMAQSAMYPPKDQLVALDPPAWEWYRPSEEEIAAMPESHKDHYKGNTLAIRKRQP